MITPALPPGFVLEQAPSAGGAPPLPPGFELEPETVDLPAVQATLPDRYAAAGIDPNEYDPTDGMGQYEKYRAGLGESLVNTFEGGKQALTDAARYFVEENPMIFGGERNLSDLVTGDDSTLAGRLRAMVASQRKAEAERRQRDAPLNATAAGKLGNAVGTVAQIVGPGMVLRGTGLASAALPRTVAGNAVQGGVVGALQPVAAEGERQRNVALGTTTGAAGAGIPKVIGLGVNALSRLSPAVTQQAQQRAAAGVLDQFAQDPAALRLGATQSQQFVPGSVPTLAEASGDVGLAGLQRTLANTPEFGNELARRQTANNLARVQAIEGGFGGANASAADTLTAARDLSARQILRPIDKLPMSSLDKVITGVNRLSEKHQAAPAVRAAMEAVKAELPNIRTVGDAHAVRQYIGQLIGGQVEGKAGAKLAKSELMTVQGLLDREMRAAYPEWGTFLREYKQASREIGQVNVGETLLDKGPNIRAAGDIPILSPAKFAGAAADLDRTVANATNFRRARADKILTPEQLKVVDDVRRDLERYSRATTDGKAIGSNTVQNAIGGNSFQNAVGPVGAAMVEPVSGVAMLGINQMRKVYGEKVAALVQEAMLDPTRAAEILAAVPAGQRAGVVRAAARLIPRVSGVAGVVAPALAE